MKKSRLMCFYVKDRYGRMVQLGRVHCEKHWVKDAGLREKVADGVGVRGYNYVAVGSLGFYKDEGPGMKSKMIDSVSMVGDELRVVVIDEVVGGVERGELVLPGSMGKRTVWRSESVGEAAESLSGGEVEDLVIEVLSKESLSKYTKKELLVMCDEWGLDVSSSWKKSYLIDYIIKNKK